MEFKDTVKQVRSELGLSQMKFAHLVGVSLQTVQKWEAGASTPSEENKEKIISMMK